MKKTLKRIKLPIATLLVLALVLTMGVTPAFAKAPEKEKVKYLGNGKVEVDFAGDVDYKNVKLTVKSEGTTYKTSIYELDDDEMKFRVKNYKVGKTYHFTIKGVRKENTRDYGKVTGSFKISKSISKVAVEDVEYLGNYKVEVEFDHHVRYKNLKVMVKSGDKSYKAEVYKKNASEVRFKLPKECRTKGKTYSFTVTGVKEVNKSSYGKATGKVKIPKSSGISKSKALSIALKDAGVRKANAYDIEVEKEYDYGKSYWEVTFDANGYEYEYAISTAGKILWKDIERD